MKPKQFDRNAEPCNTESPNELTRRSFLGVGVALAGGALARSAQAAENAQPVRYPDARIVVLNHYTDLKDLDPKTLPQRRRDHLDDSLAIGEYLAEEFPNAGLWPADKAARAHARSIVAEMHSGFAALREHLPMNIQAHYPGFYKSPTVRKEIARVAAIWTACLERFGGDGPFLFGSFTLADAFYAPVVMRFTSYDAELSPALHAYMEAVRAQPSVKEWIALARADQYLNPAYQFAR